MLMALQVHRNFNSNFKPKIIILIIIDRLLLSHEIPYFIKKECVDGNDPLFIIQDLRSNPKIEQVNLILKKFLTIIIMIIKNFITRNLLQVKNQKEE